MHILMLERYFSARAFSLTGDHDLHIWRASLNVSSQSLARFVSLLAPDERARAGRLIEERDRKRYIAGRGILRSLLGAYLDMDAAGVAIHYEAQGKPFVDAVLHNKRLQFNLSHSEDRALYVFGWDARMGIDLEQIRDIPDMDDFVAHYFSANERKLIERLSGFEKWEAFFKVWTCKESFLKAGGNGLTFPLHRVDIGMDANGARLNSVDGDSDQISQWRLNLFRVPGGYQAALAVEKRGAGQFRLRHFEWEYFSDQLA